MLPFRRAFTSLHGDQPEDADADAARNGARRLRDPNSLSGRAPKVEYRLTDLGLGLSKAFCGVWLWAEANFDKVECARRDYAARNADDG